MKHGAGRLVLSALMVCSLGLAVWLLLPESGAPSSRSPDAGQAPRARVSPASSHSTDPVASDGTLRGVVRDAEGRAVAGARVRLFAADDPHLPRSPCPGASDEKRFFDEPCPQMLKLVDEQREAGRLPDAVALVEAQSGPDGAFEFRVPHALYDLEAEAGGLRAVALDASPAGEIALVLSELEIRGEVVGDSRVHLPGTEIALARVRPLRWMPTLQSDAEGRFRVRVSPSESLLLLARSPGRFPAGGLGHLREAWLVLLAPGSIEGELVDGGRPVPGVEVALAAWPKSGRDVVMHRVLDPESAEAGRTAVTDRAGRFVFEHVACRDCMVTARAGERVGRARVEVRGGERASARVDLGGAGTLRVRVVEVGRDAPVAGASVRALDLEASHPTVELIEREEGVYEAVGLFRGRYLVDADAPGIEPGRNAFDVEEGVNDVSLYVVVGHELQVEVVDENERPVVGARVWVPYGPEGERIDAVTGPEGLAVLRQLREETYVVHVEAAGYSSDRLRGDVPSHRVLRSKLSSGVPLVVEVTDPQGGPAHGVIAELEEGWKGTGYRAASEEPGRVVFQSVPPGTYDLSANVYEKAYAGPLKVQVRRGEENVVRLALLKYRTISGRVEDPWGAPVPNAIVVWARPAEGESLSPNTDISWSGGSSDDQGRFEVPKLESGRYFLRAIRSGYSEARLEAMAGESHVRFVLRELGGPPRRE